MNRLVAQKANQFSINHYDHAISRYVEDTILEENENTKKKFIKSYFVIVNNSKNQKNNINKSTALRDTKAYDS